MVGMTAKLVVFALLQIVPLFGEKLHHLPDDDGAGLRHCHPCAYPDRREAARAERVLCAPAAAIMMEHRHINYALGCGLICFRILRRFGSAASRQPDRRA